SDPSAAALLGTEASGINDSGQVVGTYYGSSPAPHGFIYSNGAYTDLFAGSGGTYGYRINDAGQVIGLYIDNSHTSHGYIYSYSNGTFTDLGGGTDPLGINDAGQVFGISIDSSNTQHSFFYSNGTFTDLAYPSAVKTFVSSWNAINDSGQVTGNYYDSN